MTSDERWFRIAQELRDHIILRTGLRGSALVCPREKSDMTPCIPRDGGTAVCFDSAGLPLCVGCSIPLNHLIADEASRS